MTCCWRPERAEVLARVAPSFCGWEGPDLAPEPAQLVTDPQQRECLTDRLDCDPETAACRALAQYLVLCERTHLGRLMAFETAVESWPDIQDRDTGLPALGVWRGGGEPTYDRQFKPTVTRPSDEKPGLGLLRATDWNATLSVEIWCADKEERVGLRMLVEEAMTPVEWLNGVRLMLPWYGGRHVEFSLESGGFADDPQLIEAKIRRMVFGVRAVVPLWRPVTLPEAIVSSRGDVVETGQMPVPTFRSLKIRG